MAFTLSSVLFKRTLIIVDICNFDPSHIMFCETLTYMEII